MRICWLSLCCSMSTRTHTTLQWQRRHPISFLTASRYSWVLCVTLCWNAWLVRPHLCKPQWNAAPSEEGRVHVIRGDVDLNILQDCVFSHDYYSLEGSLTTPPCAETVAWCGLLAVVMLGLTFFHSTRFVMGARQRMQQRQLEFITRLFANNYHFAFGLGNNRATQVHPFPLSVPM